jgi:iron complex outermembrane receptor protein
MRSVWTSLAVPLAGLAAMTSATAQSAPDAPAPASAPTAESPAPVASEGTAPGLQEIVVTATRRSELMSKVPISISAFSQEALDARGVKDFSDLVRFTPGVTLDANGTNNISIRGISSSAGAGTTGIYIDDTPIQMRALSFYSDDALPKTFDLERVEVLRGPQGTLFGAGAEGGAVRYIMTQPNMHAPDMYVRSEFAFTQAGAPSYEAGVAYGAPIIDNELGYRASIWYRHDGGWIDRVNPFTHNTDEENANYSDDVMLRLAAKWAVSANVRITPSFLYQNRQTNDVTAYWPVYSNPNSDSYKLGDPERLPEPDHYLLPALKVEAELGGVSLFSNTSYFSRRDQSGYSGTNYNLSYFQQFNNPSNTSMFFPFVNAGYYPLIDGNGLHLPASVQNYRAPATVTNTLQSLTQELRLQSDDPNAKIVWTAGLFYSVNRQTSIEEINDPMLNTLLETLFGPGFNALSMFGEDVLPNHDSFYSYNFSRDRQLAVFGEMSYALTDQLKVTAGVRYSKTNVSFDNFADGPQNFGPSGGSGSQHENPVTPKASLSYQLNRDNLFYATYAKGFRIGGANPPIPASACSTDLANLGLTAAPGSYDSDSVKSYEIGAKNKLSNHLSVASSLYYITWQNIQQIIYLPVCGFQFTANSGDAVSKGGDLQLEYAPTTSLSFDLAVGYTDAKYSTSAGNPGSLTAATGDAIEGAALSPPPPWTVALGAQYNFVALDHKAFVRLDYQFEARNRAPAPNEDPRTAIFDPLAFTPGPTNFVSLRAGTTIDHWSVSGFVDNLFDAHPEIPPSNDPHSGVDPFNPSPPSALIRAYTLRPRTIGITASYHL